MTKYWTSYILLVAATLIVGFDIIGYVNLFLGENNSPAMDDFQSEVFSLENIVFTLIYHFLLISGVVLLFLKNKIAIVSFLGLAIHQIGIKAYGLMVFTQNSRELGSEEISLYAYGIVAFVVVFYSIPLIICFRLKKKGYFKNA